MQYCHVCFSYLLYSWRESLPDYDSKLQRGVISCALGTLGTLNQLVVILWHERWSRLRLLSNLPRDQDTIRYDREGGKIVSSVNLTKIPKPKYMD